MNNIEELAKVTRQLERTNIPRIWRKTRLHILGMGVNELARALGVSGAQISLIEAGKRTPAPALVFKLEVLVKEKKTKMENPFRFLTNREVENFPGDNFIDIAIEGDGGIEYYGESDDNAGPQFVANEDGEYIEVAANG
jgi:transcriptional regulator with XRE-family HTH domain